MPMMPPTFRPDGLLPHERRRLYERIRGTPTDRLYDAVWSRAARSFLIGNPLCRYCDLQGIVTGATVVDHFWPHRGDTKLFWQREFWIASCASCHSGIKQATERAGAKAMNDLAARLGISRPGGGSKV